ncbi:hypothetical protein CDAR_25231 [Caerostris darwini]|uniref:Uncharacterized protein n=1 Tax=Caerostris darwini TaxID=1538125 RepID=A0AAV4PDL8_9ARAC|nr:hypothetical protein CDAR_25231 [Caerostris darwini]
MLPLSKEICVCVNLQNITAISCIRSLPCSLTLLQFPAHESELPSVLYLKLLYSKFSPTRTLPLPPAFESVLLPYSTSNPAIKMSGLRNYAFQFQDITFFLKRNLLEDFFDGLKIPKCPRDKEEKRSINDESRQEILDYGRIELIKGDFEPKTKKFMETLTNHHANFHSNNKSPRGVHVELKTMWSPLFLCNLFSGEFMCPVPESCSTRICTCAINDLPAGKSSRNAPGHLKDGGTSVVSWRCEFYFGNFDPGPPVRAVKCSRLLINSQNVCPSFKWLGNSGNK